MAIPGFAEIERWIQEHGSAAILEKHVAFLKDQYAALDKKVATLQEENKQLEAKSERLELDNYKLKEKIGNLEKQLTKPREKELPPEASAILKLLATTGLRLELEHIARQIGAHPTRAEHFLNTLMKSRHIGASYSSLDPTTYYLDDKGQEYAVTHGFV